MYFQIRVEAADGDLTPRKATEIVTVNVNRNLNPPVITKPENEQRTATVTIKETENFQRVVYKVEANDPDRRVSY